MRIPLAVFFLAHIACLTAALPAQTLKAESLRRQDLPEGFPFQVLDQGFAVIRISVTNDLDQSLVVEPLSARVANPARKVLKLAQPTDITPKLMKLLQKSPRSIDVSNPPRDTTDRSRWEQTPQIESSGGSGRVSVNTAQKLLAMLGHYQFQGGRIEPGQSAEGFVYVKSKKTGRKLAGGSVELAGLTAEIP